MPAAPSAVPVEDDQHTQRSPSPPPSCPVEITLATLHGRWTTLAVREFLQGDRTFTELRHALPALSDKVLSDRLAHLTEAGVLRRSGSSNLAWTIRYLGRDATRVLPILGLT